jgi:hypothetical protein
LQNLPVPGSSLHAYFDFVGSVDEGLLGVELLEELLSLLDGSLEPDALGELELGVDDDPEALDELGELGVLAEPLEESRLELEPDIEPDGEVPDAPLEDPERDAPGLLALSQP